MAEPTDAARQPLSGWRFRLGFSIFVVGFLSPLSIPLVTSSDLPIEWKTVISGALAVGVPELFTLVAVAIMGKSGFLELKKRMFGFLRKHAPPDVVSRTRYRIGLVMFTIPFLLGWSGPYVSQYIPGYEANQLAVGVAGDLLLFSSLFVLGGDFWDKLRALFLHEAKALLPQHP